MTDLSREMKRPPPAGSPCACGEPGVVPAGSPCAPGEPGNAPSPFMRGKVGKGVNLSLIVFFCLLLFGCASKTPPPPAVESLHHRSPPAPATQEDSRSRLPDGQFGAENLTVIKRDVDTGKMLWELKAKRGSGQAKDGKIVGTLQEVQGVLYQDGKPTLHFKAENAKADSDEERVLAWGRVKAVSKVNRAELTTQKITWEAKKNLITAEGNVRIQWGDFEMFDDRLHVDTALQRTWRKDEP